MLPRQFRYIYLWLALNHVDYRYFASTIADIPAKDSDHDQGFVKAIRLVRRWLIK